MSDRYPQYPANAVSVTEILDACGLIYHASPEALERGERIHQACALLMAGRLDWSSVDSRIMGWMNSARAFKQPEIIISIEAPAFHRQLGIVGTPDLETPDVIYDFKSGPPAPWHKAQLGGYWRLLGERHRLIDVYLQDNGSLPKLVEHPASEAWRDFLTCYNFFRLKEKYGNGHFDNP